MYRRAREFWKNTSPGVGKVHADGGAASANWQKLTVLRIWLLARISQVAIMSRSFREELRITTDNRWVLGLREFASGPRCRPCAEDSANVTVDSFNRISRYLGTRARPSVDGACTRRLPGHGAGTTMRS